MRTAIVATVIAAVTLLAACSSGPTLTDTETLWCFDNFDLTYDAREKLGLKNDTRIWLENRGVEFGSEGNPTSAEPYRELMAEYLEHLDTSDPDGFIDWHNGVLSEWFSHPDGIRACEAAYELDNR